MPAQPSCSHTNIILGCDPSHHLQESLGPPGPKSQKSLKKGLFGGLENSLKKYPKSLKIPIFGPFWVCFGIFRFFRVFFESFLQTPQKTLFETFCDFGPGGPRDSCKWRLGPQILGAIWDNSVFTLGQLTASQQGKLPTEKFFPENYLEIGNGLPTRKNSVWELFGSVTGIKSAII